MAKVHRHIFCAGVYLALAIALTSMLAFPAHAIADEGDLVLGKTVAEFDRAIETLPILDASHAALIDEDGTVWFERAASEPTQIASLTKIMTALVAVEHLDAQDNITVTPEAAGVGESSAGLVAGDTMTFDMALKALLTASGNDAACAIAQAAGTIILADEGTQGDAYACENAFVGAMNSKASDLGLVNTYFTNPHGLDFDAFAQGQYSSAVDVARMVRYAMQNDLIRANIGFSQVNITVDRAGTSVDLPLTNTDVMLQEYEGTCAAKTGFTAAAGPCVATAVSRGDDHEYYAVVLGSSSKPQRFIDSEALYDWVYANREALEATAPNVGAVANEPESVPTTVHYQLIAAPSSLHTTINNLEDSYPVVAQIAHLDWPKRTVAATVTDTHTTVEVPEAGGRIEQEVEFAEVSGTVQRGDIVGHITFRQDGATLWEADLVAAEDVATPTWWEGIGVAIERFIGGFSDVPPTAESALLNPGAMKVS